MIWLLKKILVWLVKIGIIPVPKKHLYAVEIRVLMDGDIIKRFPAEIYAFSRIAARYELKKDLSFKTGTVARNLGRNRDGERLFEVLLYVQMFRKTLKCFEVIVNCKGRRDAKFEIVKRIKFSTGAAARKEHIIKHGLNGVTKA
jgi:hypothetical protein